MKASILCFCLLVTLLGLALAKKAPESSSAGAANPPKSDKLYGIMTGFGGQYTETIVQTVSIDTTTGNFNTLVNNFIYAGSSITFDGISTLDTTNHILHYATDAASAFIWGVDVKGKQLSAPIDVNALSIVDIKYNSDDSNLYFVIVDSTDAVLYGSYSVGNGPAQYLANFTDYLETTGEMGAGAVGVAPSYGVPSSYYFVTYSTNFQINVYNSTTQSLSGVPLSRDCSVDKYFTYLRYDSTNNLVWGVQETIKNGLTHYFLSVADPATGKCNSTRIEGAPEGIITCFTFSPASNNLYFGIATNGGASTCYAELNPVPGNYTLGTPTCLASVTVLSDIEVDWTS